MIGADVWPGQELCHRNLLWYFCHIKGVEMTICPVAIAVGCKKCPVFAICPAKGLIGDQVPGKSEKSTKGAREKQD
jgi:hypothetical protein